MIYVIHKLLHPALMTIMKLQRTQELILLNEHPPVSGNALYAVNHSCSHDVPVSCEVIRRHTYVLAAKQRLWLIDHICFSLNGVIWVDRDDRRSKGEWRGHSMREQIINTYIPKEKLEYWQVQKDLRTGLLPMWYEMALSEMNDYEQK